MVFWNKTKIIATPSLTAKDSSILSMAIAEDVGYVGLSFVRSAKDMAALKGILRRRAPHIGAIAKIEKPEALEDLDNIIDVADAVMVDRFQRRGPPVFNLGTHPPRSEATKLFCCTRVSP